MKDAKIKLVIGGKECELTVKEAKELHAKLAEIFDKAPIVIQKETPVFYPVYPPPTYYEPRPLPSWDGTPIVTCFGEGREGSMLAMRYS